LKLQYRDNLSFYLGAVEKNINGLLGLDGLMKSNAIINLDSMDIIFRK